MKYGGSGIYVEGGNVSIHDCEASHNAGSGFSFVDTNVTASGLIAKNNGRQQIAPPSDEAIARFRRELGLPPAFSDVTIFSLAEEVRGLASEDKADAVQRSPIGKWARENAVGVAQLVVALAALWPS